MTSLPLPIAAFLAGLASFLSPCVLPLVPGYISLISGTSVEELQLPDRKRNRGVMLHAAMFVLGFTVVFITLGALATGLGQITHEYKNILTRAAGVIIIVFGLHLTGIFKIKMLYADKRLRPVPHHKSLAGTFVMGFAFAFGWTPCIGPILSTLLALAASTDTVSKGILLLCIYSLGMAVPFLLTALGIDRFLLFYSRFARHLHAVEVASGILLITVGILILTRHLAVFAGYLGFLDRFTL